MGFERIAHGKGKPVTWSWRNPALTTFKRVIKFNSLEMSHIDSTHPGMMWSEGHWTSVVFIHQTHDFTWIMWKPPAKPKLKAILPNSWPGFLKTISVMKQGASQRTHTAQRKEEVTAKFHVVSWMRSWGRKGTVTEKWWHLKKSEI